MLVVTTNQNDFETDIYSLVKAFYPAAEIKIYLGADAGKEEISSAPGFPDINIYFNGINPASYDRILIMLYSSENAPEVTGIDIGEAQNRLEIKNALKQLLYCCLSSHTKITLPWGALTGIRPVKIPMDLLAKGYGEDEIIRKMFDVYFCSEEKARLALSIAKKEWEILTGIDLENSYSLYISIPFCPTTCLYCSFTSYPIEKYKDIVSKYLASLDKEIDFIAGQFGDKRLLTIYIGGGTPTTLSDDMLESLLKKLKESFDFTHLKEFTVEAGRPDSITFEKLKVMKENYVNRISINPQTMNEKTLKRIGRNHTPSQVHDAFYLARELGFTNINMDIILGLPGESIDEVNETLTAIKNFKPDSLTVHSLSVKRASKLTEWVNENGVGQLNNTIEIMKAASNCADALGMSPYYLYRQKNTAGNFENVGYAAPGFHGLYNILMMEEVQTIAALGAGSVSKRVFAENCSGKSHDSENCHVKSHDSENCHVKRCAQNCHVKRCANKNCHVKRRTQNCHVKRCGNLKEVDQYISRIEEMIERKRELFG
ncbi:MAG: coproporphyrinogen dehydrogenase HemZ [Lachnospiraceae bacterium]|nr:coproporphyrinogen dehydrogenase HemZ [Lachnospiraceae bacterium]